jgi:hypothetical protein
LLADGVAAERDHALGPESGSGEHAREADRAVADHRDHAARLHAGGHGRVMTCGEHVRERQERGHRLVRVPGAGHGDQRAVGERDAHRLALPAVAVGREEPARRARTRDPVAAVRARAVAERERRDHEIALRNVAHLRADVLDHADELVPDRPRRERRLTAVVPQVRPAHARQDDPDDRVGRLLDHRIGPLGNRDRAGLVEDSGAHLYTSSLGSNRIHRHFKKARDRRK